MNLDATGVLRALIANGYVPHMFTAVGPFDEGKSVTSNMMLNKTAPTGHQRVLTCAFEPAIAQDSVDVAINELVKQTRAKVVSAGAYEQGTASGRMAQLLMQLADGVQISVWAILFVKDGMLHRYSLTSLPEKEAEARAALEQLVKMIAG